jgi:hypothetical protein
MKRTTIRLVILLFAVGVALLIAYIAVPAPIIISSVRVVRLQDKLRKANPRTRQELERCLGSFSATDITATPEHERHADYQLQSGEVMVRYEVNNRLFMHVVYGSNQGIMAIIPWSE